MRLIFVRDDSPTARRRAQQTQDRLDAGGPLLEPGAAVEIAQKRRGVAAYEAEGSRSLAVFVGVLGLACFALAWVLRDRPDGRFAAVLVGIALVVLAVMTPRWMRRRYERDRQLVEHDDQQRAGRVGPPPPPPPPGPATQRPDREGER